VPAALHRTQPGDGISLSTVCDPLGDPADLPHPVREFINAATGELLRELTLDPTRNYQSTGRPPGP
jgi:hypothetical protein